MTVGKLLEAIKERVPFYLARRLLVEAGFPTGHSWSAIEEKVAAGRYKASDLQPAFLETLVATEKLACIYKLSKSTASAAAKALEAAQIDSSSALVSRFPLGLSDAQKNKALHSGPTLTARLTTGIGLVAVFSAVRAVVHREAIPATSVPAPLVGRYREVYGEVIVNELYYDVVLVPPEAGFAVVLTDNPLRMRSSDKLAGQAATRIAFNQVIGFNALVKPVNLFPAVAWLYANTDGEIPDLGSFSDTLRESREKMHGGGCVRNDPAHKAQVAAGINAQPFGITVEWLQPEGGRHEIRPTLTLSGSARLLGESSPSIQEAAIRRCLSVSELKIVLEKLIEALPATS